MDLLLWVLLFAGNSLFCGWIVFGDGADRLEGSFISGVLLWYHAPEWPAVGIRLFAGGMWFIQSIWFVVGLFTPEMRYFGR